MNNSSDQIEQVQFYEQNKTKCKLKILVAKLYKAGMNLNRSDYMCNYSIKCRYYHSYHISNLAGLASPTSAAIRLSALLFVVAGVGAVVVVQKWSFRINFLGRLNISNRNSFVTSFNSFGMKSYYFFLFGRGTCVFSQFCRCHCATPR